MNLIIFIGVPGCGKSSAAREVAKKWNLGISSWKEIVVNENGSGFFEPEQGDWPEFATAQSEHLDDFSMMTWFRAIHVPFLYKAKKISEEGKTAIVDSYFDKLTYSYLGKEPWLMQSDNKYFNIMKQICELDREEIPNPDYLIFVKVDQQILTEFLKRRGRESDSAPEYTASAISFQERLLAETEKLCQEKGIKLIVFQQEISSPQIVADKIIAELKSRGLEIGNSSSQSRSLPVSKDSKISPQQSTSTQNNNEKQWYKKAFYWPVWTGVILISSLVAFYYWGKKKNDKKEK
ncbi:AAA family ATPase [endosymbiont GvMRE of Glomus versiforme]|uniref:AAA family ATPase n=2 Tax=endosymbiont GvMRE of Glomus versiforme TaxID=2039283 RepID=UPI0011C3475F|nr:AAA family ATPase [endosymbiont GvMRE of Glomus versiforme]